MPRVRLQLPAEWGPLIGPWTATARAPVNRIGREMTVVVEKAFAPTGIYLSPGSLQAQIRPTWGSCLSPGGCWPSGEFRQLDDALEAYFLHLPHRERCAVWR